MKTAIVALAMCVALHCHSSGQTIGGLSTVAVNTEIRLPVQGLVSPGESLEALAAWASKLVAGVNDAPGGESMIEIDIGLARRSPTMFFSASSPGVYVVMLVDPTSKSPVIIAKRILVVGTGPAPTPDPTPEPEPPSPPEPPQPVVTTGQRLIFLVREISNNTPQIVMAEFSLRRGPEAAYLKGKNHQLIALSDDLGVPPNTPAAFKSAIEKAAKIGSPTLVICDPSKPTEAGVLATVPFTAPASTIIPLLQKYGG
jgi:hypothetical protein